jgi:GT2 family glycosyltransferase
MVDRGSLDLGVVIVSHDSADDLRVCLASLFRHAGDAQIAVVVSDAGSADGTASLVADFPVAFVAGANEGFARCANRVVDHAAIAGSRYLLFVNPDTEIREGTLGALLARCDALPETAVFSVRQVSPDGQLVWSQARFPNAARVVAESFVWRAVRRHGQAWIDAERYDVETECDWVHGAFFVVRRDVLDALGGFDERFFLYSEEVDLCRRAKKLGHRVTHLPLMTVAHDMSGRPPDARSFHLTHAQIVYARKWFSPFHRPFFRAAVVFKHTRRALSRRRTPLDRARARVSVHGALSRARPHDR